MALSGNLAEINLASVFQNLEQNTATGTLKISHHKKNWPIFLDKGKVSTIIPGEDWSDWYCPILVRRLGIQATDYEKYAKKLKKGQNLLYVLARRKVAKKEDLDSALRFLQEEALYEMFFLDGGDFSFSAGERKIEDYPAPFDKIDLRINPNSILMEAARRTDELSQLQTTLGSLKGVYVLSPDYRGDIAALSVDHQALISLLNGSRDIERLCRDSGLGRFQTCVLSSQLLEKLVIVPVRADDHVRLGEISQSRGDIETTSFHYKRALELRRTDARTRYKLADILAEAGQTDDAVTQYKLLGTHHSERGEWQEAAQAFQNAAQLAPKDVDLIEKLFAIYKEHSELEKAQKSGEQLAKHLVTLGLHDRAQAIYRQLIALYPAQTMGYQRGIAKAFVSMGEVPAAIESLHGAAAKALKFEDDENAALLFEEILQLDAKNAPASDQLAEIRSGQRDEKRKRWRNIRRGLIYVLVFALVLSWVAHDNQARQQLQVIIRFCYEDIERGDFDLAGSRLQDFSERYPYTLSAKHAQDHQKHLLELSNRAAIKRRIHEKAKGEDH
jgi:tetratricopeptide (TPR) repeat protein